MLVIVWRPVEMTTWQTALEIEAGGVTLPADCVVPDIATGVVLFIHGSGSNRFSQRNQQVAACFQQAGLATLLFDLLTPHEQHQVAGRGNGCADLPELTARVMALIDTLTTIAPLAHLPVGLFGSSSGAALALAAAAQRPRQIAAVVSRGGRPDLVLGVLGDVCCPTLLLVGSHDLDVLELNTWAAAQLRGEHELRVVPGAGHLFAEPGALELVSQWSLQWFLQHLRRGPSANALQP